MLLLLVLTIFIGNMHTTACSDAKLPLLRLNDPDVGERCECSANSAPPPEALHEDGRLDDQVTVYLGDVVTSRSTPEPMKRLNAILCDFLYGHKTEGERDTYRNKQTMNDSKNQTIRKLIQFPTGRVMHSDLFMNKSGVHLPSADLLHTEHCRLRLTQDHMQTAIDAFAIILEGSLTDVLALPGDYVLRSVITILDIIVQVLKATEPFQLWVSDDCLKSAVDAFTNILEGSLLLALPGDYVRCCNSTISSATEYLYLPTSGSGTNNCLADVLAGHFARTISIMKIPREKLAAMWFVVLNRRRPEMISYETLEMFRPLFKYVNGKQMARLNLSNSRIVNYIGTHPGLGRHQVGVVANKYIKLNPAWKQAKYLNNMNNLLCGVPMSFMRKIDGSEYLRLEHQVFYHVKACDPLQKRFYLNMMTRTQALGKSFSWSARDVSRLGLLLSVVEGPALASISPEAMSGITAHVMAELQPKNLRYITEMQMRYIKPKPKNILARKLKQYENAMADTAGRDTASVPFSIVLALCCPLLVMKQYNL